MLCVSRKRNKIEKQYKCNYQIKSIGGAGTLYIKDYFLFLLGFSVYERKLKKRYLISWDLLQIWIGKKKHIYASAFILFLIKERNKFFTTYQKSCTYWLYHIFFFGYQDIILFLERLLLKVGLSPFKKNCFICFNDSSFRSQDI